MSYVSSVGAYSAAAAISPVRPNPDYAVARQSEQARSDPPPASFGPAARVTAQSTETTSSTTTTLPVDQDDRSVIPAPNSGREPAEAGDRGGWMQLTVFGIMAAGSAVIFGRVLWAGHQKSRANKVP